MVHYICQWCIQSMHDFVNNQDKAKDPLLLKKRMGTTVDLSREETTGSKGKAKKEHKGFRFACSLKEVVNTGILVCFERKQGCVAQSISHIFFYNLS